MLFKLSNLNENFALTLGYLNAALNNSALVTSLCAPIKMGSKLKACPDKWSS